MSWTIDGPQLCYYNEANVVVNPMSGNYAYFANTVNYQGTVANLTAGPIPIGNVAAYQAYGLFPQSSTNISTQLVTGILSLTGTVDSVDADAADCINNGVILVGAAGDQSYKIDIPSGSDYNNYITVDVKNASNNAYVRTNRYYYHRGSSPTALNTAESAFLPDGNANSYHTMDADVVCVGAIDYTYRGNGLYFVANATAKANFSCTGPRVDIFAAGGYVAGALSTIYTANLTNGYGTKYPVTNYYANASYKQMKLSGTSQAAPQVTGVLATVLQANPYYTQLDVQNWITEQSATDKIANIGGTTTNPYTELYNLQGANNTYLYNPYQSPEPLTIDGSISITGGSISS
jgi:hypothetical protein